MPHDVSPARVGGGFLDATLTQQQRPPLVRRGTSYASQSSAHGTTRLLWRGAIATRQGYKLYGIAIIAHLFSVPSSSSSTASPAAAPASFSPFEDPFSSASKAATSGADMCLGLEMLRGKDLAILDDEAGEPLAVVHHVPEGRAGSATSSPEVERAQPSNRKGKARANDVRDVVKVETPTDVRVYIDERCPDTVEWFQDQFCREGCQGRGIKLDAGGEPIIIFAQLPEPTNVTTPSNSPSTSAATLDEPHQPPPLTLLLGRPFKPVVRKPRPDDPLPRETLFTAKLRKTASLPAAAFSKTSLANGGGLRGEHVALGVGEKKRRLSTKDKAIASLMGKPNPSDPSSAAASDEPHARRVPQRRQSSIPPAITLPFPVPVEGGLGGAGGRSQRSLSRSLSTSSTTAPSRMFSATSSSRQGSLPPPPASLDPSGRPLKRSRSLLPPSAADLFKTTTNGSPPTGLRRSSFGIGGPPSPTPSIASTTYGGGGGGGGIGRVKAEGEGDHEDAEMDDRLEELREIGIRRQRTANGIVDAAGSTGASRRGAGIGMKRSLSVPVGAGAKGKFLAGMPAVGVDGSVKVEERGEGGGEPNATEVRNKNTVKKFTMNRLQTLGIGKDHFEFKEVFSMVTRGVGFALRSTFKSRVLSPADREKAENLIEVHLRLYLPEHPAILAESIRDSRADEGRDSLRQVKTLEDFAFDSAAKERPEQTEDETKLDENSGTTPSSRGDATREQERSSDTVVGDDENMVKEMIGVRGHEDRLVGDSSGAQAVDSPDERMKIVPETQVVMQS
ncbi:hypothetical protein JCM11491_003049 [Sporobolomyces phaffii]